MRRRGFDALVIGGGPAGLAAAIELRRRGVASVGLAEREPHAGGIPRHSAHTGFGLRDMRRVMSGPRYARRYISLAQRAGVEVMTSTSVTGWSGERRLEATTPSGLVELSGAAVLLATGCRERPRSARLVPGDRPAGVLTTGALQQLVYLGHETPGRLAVVVGAEHVSFSAVLTLAHAGCKVAAMVTHHPRHQTYLAYKLPTATRYRVPIITGHRITAVRGRGRVEAVDIADASDGARRTLACDTVVFSGDWIPDHELARLGGLGIDPGTLGPSVDAELHTSAAGVFACGNLVHAAETADVAALSGRRAGAEMAAYLQERMWPRRSVPIVVEQPLAWVSPNAVTSSAMPVRKRLLARVTTSVDEATIEVAQGDDVMSRQRARRLRPTLPIAVDASWLARVDTGAGTVTVRLR